VRPDPHPPTPKALLVDIGSTTTKLALADDHQLTRLGSFATGTPGTNSWETRFSAAINGRFRPESISHIAIASMAASLAGWLQDWWTTQHHTTLPVHAIDPATAPLHIDYRPPSALGPDRLANAIAATTHWGAPVIVVDVGTAITCDLVAAGPRFAGGAIAPGPNTAYQGLVRRIPHLTLPGGLSLDDDLPLAATSTSDALHVGVLRGAAALVDSLVTSYRSDVGSCPVIVTGGLGPTVARHCHSHTVTAIDPDLTLRGIHLACANEPKSRRRHPFPRRDPSDHGK
jgi:type III pantothenate kinase